MEESGVTLAALSARLSRIERSLRRTRWALAAAVGLLVVGSAAAWRPSGTVEAERVLLTDDVGTPVIVLRGIPGTPVPSLVLETPGGSRVLTLGPIVRPVR